MDIINRSCPLCQSRDASILTTTAFDEIWSSLQAEWDFPIPAPLAAVHTPAEVFRTLLCRECGLHFFDPAIPANEDFYRELSRHCAYSQEKWDFTQALTRITSNLSILDIGCGSGAWIRKAGRIGCYCIGIDTNSDAILAAQSQGLDARRETLADFAANNPERFDLVTAFQIIEHLETVLPFVELAKSCLRPEGRLIITVPNRERRKRRQLESLDCPPHHMSRWSPQQLQELATLSGLELISVDRQPIDIDGFRSYLRARLSPKDYGSAIWSRIVGSLVVNRLSFPLLRGIASKRITALHGLSMLGVFQKRA